MSRVGLLVTGLIVLLGSAAPRPGLAETVPTNSNHGSSTITCMAGCRTQAPVVVQFIPKVLSVGPPPAAVNYIAEGIWCGDRGHCRGSAVSAPHTTSIQVSPNALSIWSW